MSSAARLAISRMLDEFATVTTDREVQRRFHRMVHRVCIEAGVRGFDHSERLFYARELVSSEISSAEAVKRLRQVFGLSRSQAYRLLTRARDMSHQSTNFATQTSIDTMFFNRPKQLST